MELRFEHTKFEAERSGSAACSTALPPEPRMVSAAQLNGVMLGPGQREQQKRTHETAPLKSPRRGQRLGDAASALSVRTASAWQLRRPHGQ